MHWSGVTTELDSERLPPSASIGAAVPDDGQRSRASAAKVVFGPELCDWGSWNWVGADLRTELAAYFNTAVFRHDEQPKGDIVVFVKQAPPRELVERLSRSAAVIYCPVDYYGSAAEIDGDAAMLQCCHRVLVHCRRLARYFEPYAPVEYIDHHVKFVAPMPVSQRMVGYILWVGVRSNLPALVEWVNQHPLPCELCVLTNLDSASRVPAAAELGFRCTGGTAGRRAIRIEHWTAGRQIELTAGARAAIDIKGSDFRSRHKPPAKAIDLLASGVPLAMNTDSSAVEHLAGMGFEVASPLDVDRWFSPEYWEETQAFGAAIRELLSVRRVGVRYRRVIEEVLVGRRPG